MPSGDNADLQIDFEVMHKAVAFNDTKETTVDICLRAPAHETAQRSERAPLTLIAAVDRSGSMRQKMPLLIRTLQFVIKEFKDTDSFGLVSYANNVTTDLPITRMDAIGKQHASALVQRLVSRGNTNLSGGLAQAISLLIPANASSSTTPPAASSSSNVPIMESDNATVIIFTDGQANVGLREPEEIGNMTRNLLSQAGKQIGVFAFGFGDDHSADVLKAIAGSNSSGIYYYLENDEKIPEAFADVLGGLTSVVAQNVVLDISPASEGVTIDKVHTSYRLTQTPDMKYSISVGDLYSAEEKDFMIKVRLPQLEAAQLEGYSVLKAEVRYMNALTTMLTTHETMVTVSRPSAEAIDPASQIPSERFQLQMNRITVLAVIEEASDLARRGELERAKQNLTKQIAELEQSSVANSRVTQALIDDLRDCLNDMDTYETYRRKGDKKLAALGLLHGKQRSAGIRGAMYTTDSKLEYLRRMREASHQS